MQDQIVELLDHQGDLDEEIKVNTGAIERYKASEFTKNQTIAQLQANHQLDMDSNQSLSKQLGTATEHVSGLKTVLSAKHEQLKHSQITILKKDDIIQALGQDVRLKAQQERELKNKNTELKHKLRNQNNYVNQLHEQHKAQSDMRRQAERAVSQAAQQLSVIQETLTTVTGNLQQQSTESDVPAPAELSSDSEDEDDEV